jgi:hypothetical protein
MASDPFCDRGSLRVNDVGALGGNRTPIDPFRRRMPSPLDHERMREMEPAEGFEPPVYPRYKGGAIGRYATPAKDQKKMEPAAGIEPATLRIRTGRYYQTELHGHGAASGI